MRSLFELYYYFLNSCVCLGLNGVVWQSVSLPLGGSRLLLGLGERTSINPVTITNLHLMHICIVLFTFTSSSAHWNISAMSFVVVHSNHLCAFFSQSRGHVHVICHICSSHRNKSVWLLEVIQYTILLRALIRFVPYVHFNLRTVLSNMSKWSATGSFKAGVVHFLREMCVFVMINAK